MKVTCELKECRNNKYGFCQAQKIDLGHQYGEKLLKCYSYDPKKAS